MWFLVWTFKDVNTHLVPASIRCEWHFSFPPFPIADDPSAPPFPTSSPLFSPLLSAALLTWCQPLDASCCTALLYFSRYWIFHHRGLECKSWRSRDTWNNRQIWPWSTKQSRAKANRVLPRECTGYSKHPLPTTHEKMLHMDITRWSVPKSDWLYSLQPKMEKLCTVSKNKTRSLLWLRLWTPYCQIQTWRK